MIVGLGAGGAADVTLLVCSQVPPSSNVVEEDPEVVGDNLSTSLFITVKKLAQAQGAGSRWCVTDERLGASK
jgi:hypothetical protein